MSNSLADIPQKAEGTILLALVSCAFDVLRISQARILRLTSYAYFNLGCARLVPPLCFNRVSSKGPTTGKRERHLHFYNFYEPLCGNIPDRNNGYTTELRGMSVQLGKQGLY